MNENNLSTACEINSNNKKIHLKVTKHSCNNQYIHNFIIEYISFKKNQTIYLYHQSIIIHSYSFFYKSNKCKHSIHVEFIKKHKFIYSNQFVIQFHSI